ncbi:MAG: sigma-70 family RNA polymerase sigma factor [Chitinophagaceae bacterium]|nr:sigma-70 family RNA polymerase sigma factor [Chitinophagaceae bacterium]
MHVVRKFPDAEIVSNLRTGDLMDDSIRSLYRDHFDKLTRYILANNGSQQDAEDIFQETIVSFIELVKKDKFRGESSIGTFLYSMNRHAWLNELKRKGRALLREEKFEMNMDRGEADKLQQMAYGEEKQEIARLVASLGDTCKKILLLFYYEERTMKEILDATDYDNEQVVRNKKYKCLKQLEQMLNEKPELKQTLKNLLHG